jgi:small-conductance mechanosensitive channel/CRP-like cAMP-binding protein
LDRTDDHSNLAQQLWDAIVDEARIDYTLWIFLIVVVTAALIHTLAPTERKRLRGTVWIFLIHVCLVPIAASANVLAPSLYAEVRFPTIFMGALTVITSIITIVTGVALQRLHIHTPRILRDILLAGAGGIAFFSLASKLGFNLSGLIATSAVLTAVIGFSLQDTLGNIIGGLALQMDNSIKVSDWIKVGDVAGKVTEIRWRYTAIETRNWETMIIPNSILMKSQVLILGRRAGQPVQWRRWIYFNVDFRFQPSDVLSVVEQMLKSSPIEGVAHSPAPNCILLGLEESYGRYAIRYWLTDLARDDPTDSVVRTRLYFALQRAKIPLSIPAYAIFQTKETSSRREKKTRADFDRRMHALAQVELFRSISDEERATLAEHLRYAPFTDGEVITKQGAEAHWLYLLVEGEVSIRVTTLDGLEKEVNHLEAPAVFGEMSLMTGHPREATVVAVGGDVECYRLEKDSFQSIISVRPEIAEHCAALLASRKTKLLAVREDLDHEAQAKREAQERVSILASIRSFFGLEDDDEMD